MHSSKILIAVYILTILSCKHEKDEIKLSGPTKIYGQVQTAFSNKPVPFAKVWLYEIGSGGFYSSFKIIADTVADINGNYAFEFSGNSSSSYKLEAAAYKHFSLTLNEFTNVPEHSNNVNVNVEIPGFAYAKFRIIKKNPASRFSMQYLYDFEGKPDEIYLSPFPNDTILYRVSRGGLNDMYYTVSTYADSFYIRNIKKDLIPHDTTEIELIH